MNKYVHAAVNGVLTAFVTFLAQYYSHRPKFDTSQLLNISVADPIAKLVTSVDPKFQLVSPPDHYDGVYLWAMAHDPFATGQAHDLIDLAAYRYGHPMYSWIAAILSIGNPSVIDEVFFLLSLASMAGAAALLTLLTDRFGVSRWWGLLVMFSPGLMYAATTALTEPFQLLLVALVLLLWFEKRQSPLLALAVVALSLAKEQMVLVPACLGLLLVVETVRTRKIEWRTYLNLAAGPIAFLAWRQYLTVQFTPEQRQYESGNVGTPIKGWLETFDYAGAMRSQNLLANEISSTATPVLFAFAALMVAAVIIGLRRFDALGVIVVGQVAMMTMLGWRLLLYPHAMYRIPAVTLVLCLFLVIVHLQGNQKQPASSSDSASPSKYE